jgi:Lysozyme like domain
MAGCAGTVYTYSQLEGLWIGAGGNKTLAPLMAAIAEAESGGCSTATNPTDNNGTQTSWGLWQISNGTHSQPSADILTGPGNAQAAVAKLSEQGLDAWGTYTSGAYKQYLNGAVPADLSAYTTGSGATGSGSTGAGCLIGNPFSAQLPLIGNVSAGPSCIFSRSQARAVIGALVLAGGGLTAALGLVLLAAYGLGHAGAGKVAGGALEGVGAGLALVPGLEAAGVATAAAGHTVKRKGGARQAAVQHGRRRVKIRRENAAEDRELQERGATELKKAQRPQPRPSRPGRKMATIPGPGRAGEAERRRQARVAAADRPPF